MPHGVFCHHSTSESKDFLLRSEAAPCSPTVPHFPTFPQGDCWPPEFQFVDQILEFRHQGEQTKPEAPPPLVVGRLPSPLLEMSSRGVEGQLPVASIPGSELSHRPSMGKHDIYVASLI